MFKVHVLLRQKFSDDRDDGSWATSNARGAICGFGTESTCVGPEVTYDVNATVRRVDHDG